MSRAFPVPSGPLRGRNFSLRPGQAGDSIADTNIGRLDLRRAMLPNPAGQYTPLIPDARFVTTRAIQDAQNADVRREKAMWNQRIYIREISGGISRGTPNPTAKRPGAR